MTAIASGRPRVAVIGSGVAGLTAAHLLQRHYDVHLFEADDRLGGHAHTHDVALTHGQVAGLDSAFLVHNDRTYPTLLRLFAELGVATQDSDMSMSVRCDGCGLEYAGAKGLGGLFAQPSSLARPRYLAMLAQVKYFHRRARAVLAGSDETLTLDEFLRRGRFTGYFAHHFLLPMVAAVWSCGFDGARGYPARYLFTFLDNHGALTVTGSPQWRTVVGGSRTYVEQAAKNLTAAHTATPIRSVRRQLDGIMIRDDADTVHQVDHAVLACHPDQSLSMLAAPTVDENRLLGAFEYLPSTALLHTDSSVLPRATRARASWNYRMAHCRADPARVRISYDISRLQRIDDERDYVVTLNDDDAVDPAAVLDRMTYAHPAYTQESVAAQRELDLINTDRLAFAGAWQGWGFHEDGCVSGVRAAASLGAGW
ncbi:MAG TPA: FAD-dependent oxidoreductase [Nakamurella sp.]